MPRDALAPAIEVHDLTVRYGDDIAVDGIDLTVLPGQILALLGPNGAGKTSTVETLEGYRRPTEGHVRVLGLDPRTDHRELTSRMGVMLQNGGVYTGARAEEVLRLFASYYPDPLHPVELLERVGLAERRRSSWKTLSGGEQQRLSLAMALVGRPEVAFLDEPTAGIDPGGRRLIRRIIAELRAEGVTVVITTHDLDEAEKLADRVAIIDHGRILAVGAPSELMADRDHGEIRFAAAPGLEVDALARHLEAAVDEVAPGEYRVTSPPSPATVAAITAWLAERDLPLGDLRAGRQRLEDVFMRLVAGIHDESEPEGPPVTRGPRRARRSGTPRR